jgi:hypothetical protein
MGAGSLAVLNRFLQKPHSRLGLGPFLAKAPDFELDRVSRESKLHFKFTYIVLIIT